MKSNKLTDESLRAIFCPGSESGYGLVDRFVLRKVLFGLAVAHPLWLRLNWPGDSSRLGVAACSYKTRPNHFLLSIGLSHMFLLHSTTSGHFILILSFSMDILDVMLLSWCDSVLLSVLSHRGHNHLSHSGGRDLLCLLTSSRFQEDLFALNLHRSLLDLHLSLHNSLLLVNLHWRSFHKSLLNSWSSIVTQSLSSKCLLRSHITPTARLDCHFLRKVWNISWLRHLNTALSSSWLNRTNITSKRGSSFFSLEFSGFHNVLGTCGFFDLLSFFADPLNVSLLIIKLFSYLFGLLLKLLEFRSQLLVLGSNHIDMLFALLYFRFHHLHFLFQLFIGRSYIFKLSLVKFDFRFGFMNLWLELVHVASNLLVLSGFTLASLLNIRVLHKKFFLYLSKMIKLLLKASNLLLNL